MQAKRVRTSRSIIRLDSCPRADYDSSVHRSIKKRLQNQKLRAGFTLLEAVVMALIIAVLAGFILFVGVFRKRGDCSKRLVCGSNMKGIITSCKIYANDNGGLWPTPPFDESMVGLIDYTVEAGSGQGSVRSPGRDQVSQSGPGGARQLSVTRSLWMHVRSGDLTPKQFVCPTSGSADDPTTSIESYYDFSSWKNVSYGFQVPFGLPGTRAHDGMDNRMILAADQGPYWSTQDAVPPVNLAEDVPANLDRGYADFKAWRPFNSQNHGGEGQNVVFADGHVNFEQTPIVGVDHDNIYTVALKGDDPASRIIGESPWANSRPPLAPRQGEESGTDSVIFP